MSHKIYCEYCNRELRVGTEVSTFQIGLFCDDDCVYSWVRDRIEDYIVTEQDAIWSEDNGYEDDNSSNNGEASA